MLIIIPRSISCKIKWFAGTWARQTIRALVWGARQAKHFCKKTCAMERRSCRETEFRSLRSKPVRFETPSVSRFSAEPERDRVRGTWDVLDRKREETTFCQMTTHGLFIPHICYVIVHYAWYVKARKTIVTTHKDKWNKGLFLHERIILHERIRRYGYFCTETVSFGLDPLE
jgi:hypothetical protein